MPENLSIFTEKLKERNTIKDLDAAKQAIPVNINQAVSMFTAIMKRVSECINKKVKVTKQYPRQTWFDKECQQAKTEVKRTLRNFRRSNSMEGMLNSTNSTEYCSQESLIAIKLK